MKKNQKHKTHSSTKIETPTLELEQSTSTIFFTNKTFQILILLVVSFCFYFNTIWNDYLLDDVIVITKNKFTLLGFSGIWDILSKDTFEGYTTVKGLLSGGRYRPLSLVTFAIEIGLFGTNHPMISHFINVLLYCTVVLMLFLFLDKFLFKKQPLLSFLSTFIFAIHPIHTEIVANIKSRDELMALLFTLIALHLFYTYLQNKKEKKYLIISLISFFLSLLSKENAVTYLAIIPLMLYFFDKQKLSEAIFKTLPFLFVTLFYLFIRVKITGIKSSPDNDIMNSPYLFATGAEKFATKMEVMGKYLLLLIFPHPQSYDYSYSQIEYIKPSNIKFLISLVINSSLIIFAFKKFKERNIYSFAILFYFISISLVSNFLFDVGAPMGDRFLFQPSIGFAIAVAATLIYFIEKVNWQAILTRKIITSIFILGIFILCGFKTIKRNAEWKNEDVLYLVDIEASPNSAHANMNAAVSANSVSSKATDVNEKKIWFDKSIAYFKKGIKINPRFIDAYVNMGATYFLANDAENAALAWENARALNPAHPLLASYFGALSTLFCTEGVKLYNNKNIEKATEYYNQAVKYNPNNADALYYLGGTFLMKNDVAKARELWTRTLQINPNHAEAQKWLNEISKK